MKSVPVRIAACLMSWALAPSLVMAGGAEATSGPVFRKIVQPNLALPPVAICVEAHVKMEPLFVTQFPRNTAWIGAYVVNDCVDGVLSDPGHLGVSAAGFKDGALCGATSFFYNQFFVYRMGAQADLCPNPQGTNTFKTLARADAWDAPTNDYFRLRGVNSPNVSHLTDLQPEQTGLPGVIGRIPDEAFTPDGIDPSLVPDFVTALDREGAVAGYVRKGDVLESRGRVPRLVKETIPVFGESTTTLVGHMYPGFGFVPLGQSPTNVKPFAVTVTYE